MNESNYQQQNLLSKCLQILKEELIVRTTLSGVSPNFFILKFELSNQVQEEAIHRRLYTDKAAKRIRKVFADIKWVCINVSFYYQIKV